MAIAPARGEMPVDNVRGAMWMISSSLVFVVSTTLSTMLARQLPPFEVVFFRCLFGLTIVVPFLMRHGLRAFRTQRPDLHLIRIVCVTFGMNLGFYALAKLPLATAMSISYSRPLFMIVLGVTLLGEHVGWRRGAATVVGFVGVLVVMGPMTVSSWPAASASLIASAFTAGSLAVVRKQAATDGPTTIMVWFAVGTAISTAIPAAFVWQTPSTLTTWLLLGFVGVSSTFGQYLQIRALTYGEATVMNPIDYAQLPMTAIAAFWVFGEVPPANLWLGAAIIAASTLYILLREARLKTPAG